MGRRRKLLVGSLVVFAIAAAIGGARRTGVVDPLDPAMAPTPTIRDGSARGASDLHRGRVRVMPIRVGELRLEGEVVDDAEKPVGGARVTLGNARETVTEADGSFVFDHLAAGDYQLAAENKDAYTEGGNTTLTADSEPVTLKLRRGANLVVHVVDPATKTPIAGATVKTYDRNAITDDSGTVMLRAIDGGFERVELSAVGRATVSFLVTSDAPGKTLERTVELGRAAPVSGVVVDVDGKSVPNAKVSIEAAGGVWSDNIEADAAGRWMVATLGAGKHAAHATSDLHVQLPDVTFESDGVHATTGVVVRVAMGGRISGIVVDANGRPIADVGVHAGGNSEVTGKDGRFLLQGVRPGEHAVSTVSTIGAAPDVPVKLALGGTAEVRLVFHDATIAGIAVDARGQPVANAWVRITHTRTKNGRSDRADDYGKFDFGGVELGDYTISAHRDNVVEYEDQVPAPIATGNRQVRVVVPEAATVRGRVTLDGKPVEEYGIVVSLRLDPTWSTPTIVRAADGRFSRSDLGAGAVVITIVGNDFVKRSIENVQMVAGKTLDLGDLAVERGHVISGRVVDGRGTPVAGAMVSIVAHGSTSYDHDDTTLKRRLSEPFARTDAAGRYKISGVRPAKRGELRIEATHTRGIAPARPLAPSNDPIELVLAETGVVEGTIANYNDGQWRAVATSIVDPEVYFQADLDRAGSFRFARLPAGEYGVRIRGKNTMSTQRVAVVAGGRSVLAFALPVEPITLTIRAAECIGVTLRDLASDEQIELEGCEAGASEIKHVSPGRYRVCVDLLDDDCKTIDVAAAPSRQTVVIPRR